MKRAQPERSEQRQIVKLLEHLGVKVYRIGTTRKRTDHPGTMQTPGLPDLLAFLPDDGGERFLVIEVKAPGGRRSRAQQDFADHCAQAGLAYVVGGLEAVVSWLLAFGYLDGVLTDWRIPRHRVPA